MTKWNRTSLVHKKLKIRLFIAGLILAITQNVCATTPPESVTFSHKDWDLICDNTLTCRAVGYSDYDTDPAATVLLSRKAGPSTPVINLVMLANDYEETDRKRTERPFLLIDDRAQGKLLPGDDEAWQMSEAQFNAFQQALGRDSKISFKDNVHEYIFSSAGSSAVLLKMDDVQGRIGTTGAVIKKGSKSETEVKMPVAVPVIVKAPVRDKQSRDMTPQEMALIKPSLLKFIDSANDCSDEQINGIWQIASLNEKQSLVIAPCWMAAYNFADMYFVISNDLSFPAVIVTDSATSYEDGVINFHNKGRGLGDCLSQEEWVWDGKRFIPSAAETTGRCRLIRPGGAWQLPTLITNVITR